MKVSMHIAEWENLKFRHTDELETLHRKLCKAEESVKELTIKIEGSPKGGYPTVVGFEEQYRQQELNLKEHQAEITHLRLQLKQLEALKTSELKGKDGELVALRQNLEHRVKSVTDQHAQILKLETELLSLRKDAQEALELAEGKGWTLKPGEEKGPLFKRISSMLQGADECQKERMDLRAQLEQAQKSQTSLRIQGENMARYVSEYQKAVFNASLRLVDGKLRTIKMKRKKR